MFTIKHVDPQGNEFAIEAESYSVQWDREADLVRVMSYNDKVRDAHNYADLWVGVPARPSNCNGLEKHTVYVMNRYGSTVSTTHYVDIPPGHFGGE